MPHFHPKVIYREPDQDKRHSVIRYIANRVLNNNKNFLCAVTGQTGGGKSWTTGAIGELYSELTGIPYDPERHVVFSFTEFIELINNGEALKLLRVGTCITFDEPQVSINARSWQSQANQCFNALVSTFRNLRLVVFFATPFLEFLDLQTRTLFHAEFEMIGIDKVKQVTRVKPMFLEYNAKQDYFYRKYLDIVYMLPGKLVYTAVDLRIWEVPKPSDKWIAVYERRKKEFTQNLNKKLAQRIAKSENKDIKERKESLFDRFIIAYQKCGADYFALAKELPGVSAQSLRNMVVMAKKSQKV